MNQWLALWQKDLRNEWRNFYQWGGLLAFLSGVCYLIYFFGGRLLPKEWNLLYWLCFLFLCFFIGSRVFEEDQSKYRHYLHQLVSPFRLFVSKVALLFVQLLLINGLILFLFILLLKGIQPSIVSWMGLCVVLDFGMSVLICFAALINAYARNNTLLLTVILLPLSFPLIGMSYSLGLNIIEGQEIWSNFTKLQLLIAIDLMAAALAFFILPQLYRA